MSVLLATPGVILGSIVLGIVDLPVPPLWAQWWLVLTSVGFAIPWMIFFTGRWIARGFTSAARQRETFRRQGERIETLTATLAKQIMETNRLATKVDEAYRGLAGIQAQLSEVSFKDEVTGLANRRSFLRGLEEEVSRHRYSTRLLSLVLLELHGAKAIREDLGQWATDSIVLDVARTLAHHSTGANLVARYDDERFAILLVETAKADARHYVDSVGNDLSAYRFSHGRSISPNFGIASLSEDEVETAQDLLRAATQALRAARGERQLLTHALVNR